MNPNQNPVVLRGIRVAFGKRRVLDSVDFELQRGSVTALVGDNAAGKSTLLRILVGAVVADGGSARVLGLDPAHDGVRVRAQVGYVADRMELPNWMRVRDWLGFCARFYPNWSEEERARLCELLELEERVKVRELSKGNRAKLGLIAALAHRPQLLLLDEAFSGLDAKTRHRLSKAVLDHLRDDSRSVLLVSHSTADIERLCDRVAILEGGRIVREGDIETLALASGGGLDLDAVLRHEPVDESADVEVLA